VAYGISFEEFLEKVKQPTRPGQVGPGRARQCDPATGGGGGRSTCATEGEGGRQGLVRYSTASAELFLSLLYCLEVFLVYFTYLLLSFDKHSRKVLVVVLLGTEEVFT